MEVKEARAILRKYNVKFRDEQGWPIPRWMIDEAIFMADELLAEAQKKEEADGCQGCAFSDVEEWEMPCAKCRRACKDYWRPAKDERL